MTLVAIFGVGFGQGAECRLPAVACRFVRLMYSGSSRWLSACTEVSVTLRSRHPSTSYAGMQRICCSPASRSYQLADLDACGHGAAARAALCTSVTVIVAGHTAERMSRWPVMCAAVRPWATRRLSWGRARQQDGQQARTDPWKGSAMAGFPVMRFRLHATTPRQALEGPLGQDSGTQDARWGWHALPPCHATPGTDFVRHASKDRCGP